VTKYPSKVSELPEGECYAILHPESMTIPGDERSRTHPGHGYPEHSVDYWKIETFKNKEEWEQEIARLIGSRWKTEFKAVVMKSVKVETKVVVKVSE